MVKIMESPIKMDDLGGPPLFLVQHPYRGLQSIYYLLSAMDIPGGALIEVFVDQGTKSAPLAPR